MGAVISERMPVVKAAVDDPCPSPDCAAVSIRLPKDSVTVLATAPAAPPLTLA